MKKIVILGNGLSGCTIASKLCSYYKKYKKYQPKIELIGMELGGLCIDDVYKQKYGPHIFHTNNKEVFDFFKKYSDITPYFHTVKSCINGKFFDFPTCLQEKEIEYYKKHELTGDFLYSKLKEEDVNYFFKEYSRKQWGMELNEIPREVFERIKFGKANKFASYFTDKYQFLPTNRYYTFFKNIITDCETYRYFEHIDKLYITYNFISNKLLKEDFIIISTIRPDLAFFNRNLFKYVYTEFNFTENKSFNNFFENNFSAVINFPYNFDFTRITNYERLTYKPKYFSLEYPSRKKTERNIETHPIYWKNQNIIFLINSFIKNIEKSFNIKIHLLGRLGKTKYLDMDKAISEAFDLFEKIKK